MYFWVCYCRYQMFELQGIVGVCYLCITIRSCRNMFVFALNCNIYVQWERAQVSVIGRLCVRVWSLRNEPIPITLT
jgi:hypothetical protein